MDVATLSGISESLPEEFGFYGFGEVKHSPDVAQAKLKTPEELQALLAGKIGVSFKLLGEPTALLVVIFSEGLDVSMYCELGNILASKLCQKLSEGGEGDLMITPPLLLGAPQLARLSRSGIPCIHRSYRHVDGDSTILLEALILPNEAGGQTGNA